MSMRRRSRRRNRGVTLIELMVTIALIGLLTALGFPSLSTWIRNTQVRTVGEALQNGLRVAQSEALRQNRPVLLAFTNSTTAPPTAAPWPVAAGGKNWWVQTVPKFSETTGRFISGGTLTDVASGVSIGSGPAAVCFNSNGRVVTLPAGTGAGATGVTGASCAAGATAFDISQSGADRNLRVTLTVGGQVRLCDPKLAAPDGC